MIAAGFRLLSMASLPSNTARLFSPSSRVVASTRRLASLASQLHPSSSASAGNEDVDSRGKIFSSLAVPSSAVPAKHPSAKAAVLICLFEGSAGELRVILTKRSSNLSSHSGEVSLPGGKAEKGDADERATALREAKEEIGLEASLVSVVTVLDPFVSKHHLQVFPVVGILHNRDSFTPVLNPDEVEEIFDAPLEMFLKGENRRSERREWMGSTITVHFFDLCDGNKKFLIWGLTASILMRAASVIYKREPVD